MLESTYSFEELKIGSRLIRDLIQEKDTIKHLVSNFFDHKKIADQISQKDFDSSKRQLLVKALKRQNEQLELSSETKQNIESLNDENTFTITTGHQLNLFSGPLYSI